MCTDQRKICVHGLNILCQIAGSGYTSAGRCDVIPIDTHVRHPDFIKLSKLATKLKIDSTAVDYLIWGALQQLVNRQKHRLPETSPEQLLGDDQP